MEKKIKNKKNFLHRKGFSFIESILAVFLVSVGVVAGLKLLTSGLKDSMESRDQFAASLLAQEGVELVRNIRDNNWVDNDPSKGSFFGIVETSEVGSTVAKHMDYTSTALVSGTPYQLRMEDGFYKHGGSGTQTKFRRKITTRINDAGEDSVTVTSLVSWSGSAPGNAITDCNTSTKCAYTQIILNKWGE